MVCPGVEMELLTNRREISLDVPRFMGIVNATPDSFSDGGRTTEECVAHAMALLGDGADILDIGGESTRPGAVPITVKEEIARVVPVIRGIRATCEAKGLPLPLMSIDTYHAETARVAIAEGVEMLNDIMGMEDPEMIRLARETGVAVCFMHGGRLAKDRPNRWENGVLDDVFQYLAERRDVLLAAGIERNRLVADVGLGFGKTAEENLELVRNIERFHELGIPQLVGHSRKRFLALVDEDREKATEKITARLLAGGVQILRLHVLRTPSVQDAKNGRRQRM